MIQLIINQKIKKMKNVKLLILAFIMVANYMLTAQVSINTDGYSADGSAMLDVKSTNKGFLPPRMSLSEREAISSPATGLMIYNTTTNKPNYFNGTEWMAFDGTSAGLAIGDYFHGGIIFYLDGSGGGLVCAIEDQDGGLGIQWYNGSYTTTGATGTVIGTGQANTTAIINNQGAGSYAATVCDNYTVGAYSDWFLPSKDELNKMYQNKIIINTTATANGGSAFASAYYWSSSEFNNLNAWLQSFIGGAQGVNGKDNTNRVRAVRAF